MAVKFFINKWRKSTKSFVKAKNHLHLFLCIFSLVRSETFSLPNDPSIKYFHGNKFFISMILWNFLERNFSILKINLIGSNCETQFAFSSISLRFFRRSKRLIISGHLRCTISQTSNLLLHFYLPAAEKQKEASK